MRDLRNLVDVLLCAAVAGIVGFDVQHHEYGYAAALFTLQLLFNTCKEREK